jgi:hypothetical protein
MSKGQDCNCGGACTDCQPELGPVPGLQPAPARGRAMAVCQVHGPYEGPACPKCAENSEPSSITMLERLEHTTNEQLAHIAEIHDFLTGVTTPPQAKTIRLNATRSREYDQAARVSPSIGVYNGANDFSVFLGIGGEVATAQGGALEVPARSALVLPTAVQDLELGVDPIAIGGSTATVLLLRFFTVQAFFFGAWK